MRSTGGNNSRVGLTGIAGAALLMLLTACGEKNTFVALPPPQARITWCGSRCSRRSRRIWRQPAMPLRSTTSS